VCGRSLGILVGEVVGLQLVVRSRNRWKSEDSFVGGSGFVGMESEESRKVRAGKKKSWKSCQGDSRGKRKQNSRTPASRILAQKEYYKSSAIVSISRSQSCLTITRESRSKTISPSIQVLRFARRNPPHVQESLLLQDPLIVHLLHGLGPHDLLVLEHQGHGFCLFAGGLGLEWVKFAVRK